MTHNHQDNLHELLAAARDGKVESLDDLAHQTHLSRFHLSRMLKKHLGFTLRDFLAAVKVDRAIEGLLNGYSVTRSQLDAGHESPSSFSKAFHRFTGTTPSMYRAQMASLASFLMRSQDEQTSLVVLHRKFRPEHHQQTSSLHIRVEGNSPRSALFVALHPDPLVKGEPLLGIALLGTNGYTVSAIPNGSYFAMVVEVPRTADIRAYFQMSGNRRQLERQPIEFPLARPKTLTLKLRELIPEDPPITVNLPKLFLEATAGRMDLQLNRKEVSNSGQADRNSAR